MAINHSPTGHGLDQKPGPNRSHASSGTIASSAPAGDGTPVKNPFAHGLGFGSSSSELNLANRNNVQAAYTRHATQPNVCPDRPHT